MGTPDYMAPEQLEHARANIQSDVYSLGLVLYEMVTGARPFAEASAWKCITTDPPPPRKLAPDLPDHWNKTIACCLERNPNYRFQTAQAVLDGLEGDPSSAKIPPKPVLVRLKRAVSNRVGAISIFFLLAMFMYARVYRYFNQPHGGGRNNPEALANDSVPVRVLLERANEIATHAQAESNPLNSRAQYEDAAGLLRLAISKEPSLAIAHARLADILISTKQYWNGYAEWNTARQLAERAPVSRESLQIQAQFYSDTGDYKTAEQIFGSFASLYPDDYLAQFYWGTALDDLDRKEDALEKFKIAAQLSPDSYVPHQHMASLYLLLGNFAKANGEIKKVRSLGALEWATWLEGHSAFLQGNYDMGVQKMRSLLSSSSIYWRSRAFSEVAALLAEQGKVQEALSLLQEGSAYDHSHGYDANEAEKLLAQAYLQWARKNCSAVHQLALDAVVIESSPLRLYESGTVLARCGFAEDAGRLLSQLDPDSPIARVQYFRKHLAVEIGLATNHISQVMNDLSNSKFASGGHPWEHQAFLAHAFDVAKQKDRAKAAFIKLVDDRGRIWMNSSSALPGLWSNEALAYIATYSKSDEPNRCTLLFTLKSLRAKADAEFQGMSGILNADSRACQMPN